MDLIGLFVICVINIILMMDLNDENFDFLDPLSPALGLLKTSPYLSPLFVFDSAKNSDQES